jgi:molybdate transport system substrate-binding protein
VRVPADGQTGVREGPGVRRVAARALLLVTLVLMAWSAAGCAGTEPAEADETDSRTVRVAAAADLKFALEEVVTLLSHDHPGLRVDIVYGSSGTFLQQIQSGAPFDLYLSADLAYPQAIVDAGLADPSDLFPYAVGRLVLWVPDGSPVDPTRGLSALTGPAVTRLAIANPEHAPYGKAAVAALERAGVFEEVEPRLVLGENIAQAAEFVQSGNASAGIVAKSLVLSDPLREVGTWWELPLGDYPRLEQGGVVLSGSQDADAARLVRDALLSEEGTAIMASYGFSLPGT